MVAGLVASDWPCKASKAKEQRPTLKLAAVPHFLGNEMSSWRGGWGKSAPGSWSHRITPSSGGGEAGGGR